MNDDQKLLPFYESGDVWYNIMKYELRIET